MLADSIGIANDDLVDDNVPLALPLLHESCVDHGSINLSSELWTPTTSWSTLSVLWGVERIGNPPARLAGGVASPGTSMRGRPGLVGHGASGHEGPAGANSFPIAPRICMLLSLLLLIAVAVAAVVANLD